MLLLEVKMSILVACRRLKGMNSSIISHNIIRQMSCQLK
jgi:hypothetical protein